MKNLKNLFFLVLSLTTLISCSYEPEIGSNITIYPIITVLGGNPVFVAAGGIFTEPGVSAMAGTAVAPVVTTAEGKYRGTKTLDTNKVDEYLVNYKATNSDGFSVNSPRKVIVYKTGDLINSIEGLYTCTISRNGAIPSAAYRNIKYIYIWKNTDGSYEISDAFGGWYEYGRNIGVGYITPGGKINVENIATNSFTFPNGQLTNSTFGGTAKITNLTVDAATKTIVLTCVWNTAPPITVFTFIATMKQVQP